MFKYNGKKTQSNQTTKPLEDLIAIETSAQLLSVAKRQALLTNVFTVSGLEQSRYDDLCLSLIASVANQCQHLPESANQYYAAPGGYLDNILNRTDAALHLFRQHLVQGQPNELSEEQKLWMYALFSAGILQGVGKLQTDYDVDLYDTHGSLIKKWQPILDNLPVVGRYYYYEFLQANDDELRCRLNLILAYKLMPLAGLVWIASNPDVLATWLALLDEDMDSAGTLGAILERAQHIASQRYVSEFTIVNQAVNTSGRGNRNGTFLDVVPEGTLEKERLMGAAFIQWLNKEIAAGNILINQAQALLIIQGGLLLSTNLFKQFAQDHAKYKNWQAVQHAYLAWGNQRAAAQGKMHASHEHAKDGKMVDGIVIDTAILPDEVHLYDAKTDKTTVVSALVVEQMTKLNQPLDVKPLQTLSLTGKWEVVEKAMPWLSAGMKIRV